MNATRIANTTTYTLTLEVRDVHDDVCIDTRDFSAKDDVAAVHEVMQVVSAWRSEEGMRTRFALTRTLRESDEHRMSRDGCDVELLQLLVR